MTDTERQRLAAILGMLGSEHEGERAAAALQAEAFRRKHGLTWEQLVRGDTIYVDREVFVDHPIYVDRPMPLVASIIDQTSIMTVPGFAIWTVISLSLLNLIARIIAG